MIMALGHILRVLVFSDRIGCKDQFRDFSRAAEFILKKIFLKKMQTVI
jgi:hypothetical protein